MISNQNKYLIDPHGLPNRIKNGERTYDLKFLKNFRNFSIGSGGVYPSEA